MLDEEEDKDKFLQAYTALVEARKRIPWREPKGEWEAEDFEEKNVNTLFLLVTKRVTKQPKTTI